MKSAGTAPSSDGKKEEKVFSESIDRPGISIID